MTRNGGACFCCWIPPDLMTAFSLPVEDKSCPSQPPDHLIGTEASKPSHQDIVTGMCASPRGAVASLSLGGSSSPCSM
jgi:hypothetical protein